MGNTTTPFSTHEGFEGMEERKSEVHNIPVPSSMSHCPLVYLCKVSWKSAIVLQTMCVCNSTKILRRRIED